MFFFFFFLDDSDDDNNGVPDSHDTDNDFFCALRKRKWYSMNYFLFFLDDSDDGNDGVPDSHDTDDDAPKTEIKTRKQLLDRILQKLNDFARAGNGSDILCVI